MEKLAEIDTAARTQELFEEHKRNIYVRTDRLFVWLMPVQWIAGIVIALWISPLAWAGAQSSVHPHVWAAVFLGGAITFWPVFCAVRHPGTTVTRYTIAIGQMLMSALLIHLSGGRIETHFHVFGSLAVIACYRDWRVLVAASVVVAIDHFVRGVYFPLSVFGVLTTSPYRWIEHAAWVAFEDLFLIISIRQSVAEMFGIAERQATLETMNARIEGSVAVRTSELTREIAERERIEEHLRQIQHDNELIFSSITEGIHRIDCDGRIIFENPAAARMLGWEISDLIGQPAHKTMHHSHEDGRPYPQSECPIYGGLKGGAARRVEDEVFWRKDGTSFPAEYTTTPVRDEKDAVIGAVVVFSDSTERKRAEGVRQQLADQLARERKRFEEILNNIPVVVFENYFENDIGAHFVSGHVERMYGFSREEWTSAPDFWFGRVHPEDQERVAASVKKRFSPEFNGGADEFRSIARDGRIVWSETHVVVLRDETDKVIGFRGITIDVTERKNAEAEMERMHKQLMDASRHAGMAEVATNVLHNVGNVLNSVNISHSVVSNKIRGSAIESVTKLANLIEQHANDLPAFLTTDRAGQNLPKFLGKVAKRLTEEQESVLAELEMLGGNIEHIKEIIAVQQSYAQAGGVRERLEITGLLENALQINGTALARHRIQIVREYGEAPPASLEKHKVMQILVNLVGNAKHALSANTPDNRRLTLRTLCKDGRIFVSVTDNGIGISPENMIRIFAHGFTTKKDGHGFGLHSAALAAKEMGGSLSAESAGLGHGSTFTLELPLGRGDEDGK
jgi:PAS domain S-box-containing protein